MTREEAKSWLRKLYARADITDEYGDMEDMQPYEEAINMAITALSENKGDLISRQAVLDALMEILDRPNHAEFLYTDEICRALEQLPPVENKGEWMLDYRDCGIEFYHCSRCNLGRAVIDGDYYKSLNEFKKCPICGVDMGGNTE